MDTQCDRRARGPCSRGRFLVAALGAGLLAGAAAAQELNSRVESVIANSKIAGAHIGVSIIDLENGRTLADIHADAALIPASNMKLLTSGTALLVLGEE